MKFINKIRSLSRRTKMVLAATILTAAVVAPFAVNAEFYPVRPTFDYNKYNGNNNCNDPNNIATQNGRCGSMNGPVFNSFINTPSYGDERAFFDGRRSDKAADGNKDAINDVTNGSKEVILRTYVHNNANQNTNASGKGIAKNTKVRIALPTATEQVLRARSYISADNAAMVEDTADMLGSEKFTVSYVPGSAKLLRGTAAYGLSDSIVTTGALIGDKTMNGQLPGCFEYAALVEIKVKINVKPTPKLQLTKEVRAAGTSAWSEEINTKPGDKVQWLIGTKNISNATLTEVKARDVLPPHLSVVPGSVKVFNGNTSSVQSDGPLFGGGLILNTYPSAGIKYVMFDTVVKDDFTECSVRLRNLAYANSKETPTEEQDSAVINVNKEKCNPPVTPQYSCDLLTATKIGSGREVKYTASASASGGATIKNYVYSFGDGSNDVTTSNTSVNHIYGKDGKYNARVTVMVIVGNSVKEVSGQNCQTTVEFKKEVTPSYSCDLLSLEKTGKSREVKLTVKASADGGAEIKRYVYSFGDGTDNLTTDKNVVLHTYAKDGTYAARVKVQVQVGDEVKEVESDKCAVPVTFTTPKPPVTPPTTPVTPGALPNTGAGNIIATFLAVSGVSTFAYYIVSRRFARF